MLSLKLLPHTAARYYRVLTVRKVWNAVLVVASYLLSNLFRRDIRKHGSLPRTGEENAETP